MSENSVTFKGTVNGLTIILREEDDFDTIFNQIDKKVASAGRFFKGATLAVKYRGKKLSELEREKIFQLISAKSGAEIKSFEEDTDEQSKAADEPVVQQNRSGIKKFTFFKGIDEGNTKFYKGTVRSGQLISYDGNVVVIGDVNPGGVVEATGNIVIAGSLRGVVHAGSDGNKEAVVVAFNLQPTQLRIADVITRCPDEKDDCTQLIPEMAFIKGDMVYIERYLPQYK